MKIRELNELSKANKYFISRVEINLQKIKDQKEGQNYHLSYRLMFSHMFVLFGYPLTLKLPDETLP